MSIVRDCYGREIKIGDKLIPVCGEALASEISGELQDIHFDNDNISIDVFNPKVNQLYKNQNPLLFTTKHMFDNYV